jgi:hypothetical protein
VFGLIADQSGCPIYAVAWLDRKKQQVEARCAETLMESEQIVSGLASQTRFIIDVPIARAEHRKRFGEMALAKFPSVLAHLLAINRRRRASRDFGVPLLLYRQTDSQHSAAATTKFRTLLHGRDRTIFVFPAE